MKNRSSEAQTDREFTELLWVDTTARMVRQEVVDRLREAILLGRFQPGQRLLERELCEWTGVSRTSVREALRQLESEGLVENIPRRGPAVSVVSPEEVKDIYEVRKSLEPHMVEYFIERATDNEIEELIESANAFGEAVASENRMALSESKRRYFDILLHGCHNGTLGEVVHSLHLRLTLVKSTYLQQPARWLESVKELKAIAQAIKARDKRRSCNLFRKHLDAAASAALEALRTAREQSDGRKVG